MITMKSSVYKIHFLIILISAEYHIQYKVHKIPTSNTEPPSFCLLLEQKHRGLRHFASPGQQQHQRQNAHRLQLNFSTIIPFRVVAKLTELDTNPSL